MKNLEIRHALAKKKMKYWQLADLLGIADGTLSRKLRYEIEGEEKEKILSIIENFRKE